MGVQNHPHQEDNCREEKKNEEQEANWAAEVSSALLLPVHIAF